jgi:hypothetical protein
MYRSVQAPNFESFAAAARAGNRASAIAFNPGVAPRLISMTPHEDYTAGEESDTEQVQIRRATDGLLDGVQVQVLSYLGRTWGMGEPRFTTEQAAQFSGNVRKAGGAITWDVPVEKNGLIPKAFVEQLGAIGKALGKWRAKERRRFLAKAQGAQRKARRPRTGKNGRTKSAWRYFDE